MVFLRGGCTVWPQPQREHFRKYQSYPLDFMFGTCVFLNAKVDTGNLISTEFD